jgi:large subunit ribosomal protein L25
VLVGEAARNTLVVSENTTLSIIAEALHLPDHLDVSIEGLEAGSQITAGDVTLPEGSELAVDPATTIAIVSTAQTAEQLEGDTGEAAEEPTEEPDAEAAS